MPLIAVGPPSSSSASHCSAQTTPPYAESLPPLPAGAARPDASCSRSSLPPTPRDGSFPPASRDESFRPPSRNGSFRPADSDRLQPLLPPQSAAAAPRPPLVSGIPIGRHRAKLEECAALHYQLQEMATELCAEQERLIGSRRECESYATEIMRLRDVLHTATSELQLNQRRVEELERENAKLRREIRAQGTAPAASKSAAAGRVQYYRTEPIALPRPAAQISWVDYTKTASSPSYESLPSALNTNASGLSPLKTQHQRSVQESLYPPLHTDVHNVTGAMSSYVCECFHAGVTPHMELLHSLHDGGRLVAVDPPVTFAQLSAMERVLRREPIGNPEQLLLRRRMSRCTSAESASLLNSSGPVSWVAGIEMLSFRCENWSTDAMPIFAMLRTLPEVRRVELAALRDVTVMRQFAEALLMLPCVEDLSLPELALDDDGLAELGALLTRRDRIASAGEAEMSPYQSHANASTYSSNRDIPHTLKEVKSVNTHYASSTVESAGHAQEERPVPLALRCADFSRCHISNPMALGRILCGASVEVLILTGCHALRDPQVRDIVVACPQLHTMDLSGCVNLSTACITSLNTHESLRVLRLENCPGIRCIELDRLVVLFSSLAHVMTLRAPELQRLPVPITHAHVLSDFYAPQLMEITLKGILIDRGTLRTFTRTEGDASDAEQLRHLTSFTPYPSTRVPTPTDRHLQSQPRPDSSHGQEVVPEDGVESLCIDKDLLQCHGDAVPNSRDCVAIQLDEFSVSRGTTPSPTPKLVSVGFVDCVIVCGDELESFVQHQSQLQRLSLHGSRGVTDNVLLRLPSSLIEIDLGGVAQLTSSCVDALVTRTPRLVRLSLKNAGPRVMNSEIRRLHALVNLEVLNLLSMPQLQSEVVAAIAMALPRLRVLYHETAVVGGTASPVSAGPVVCVERSDAEDAVRLDVQNCARELLRLRDETALALWMEARLPRAESLLPARPTTAKGVVDLGAPQPPLTAHTTYYEVAARTITPLGRATARCGTADETDNGEGTRVESRMGICDGGEDDRIVASFNHACPEDTGNAEDEDDEDDEEQRAVKEARRAEAERRESAMGEKERLAVERAPLGPWGAADVVAKHIKQSSAIDARN